MAWSASRAQPVDLGALKSALSVAPHSTLQRPLPDAVDVEVAPSRIAAASEGTENWHEARASRSSAKAKTVLLRVAHSPAVVIRASPHTDAPVVTYCRTGTTLLAVGRLGVWVRLALANFRDTRRVLPALRASRRKATPWFCQNAPR